MPSSTISSNATLHALTERLASHSNGVHPLIGTNFSSSYSSQAGTAQASAYRQPAPPPQLPVLQLVGRHQYGHQSPSENPTSHRELKCPAGVLWPERGLHEDKRCARCEEEELDVFISDMGMVLRREFDCWVELCW